MKLLKFFQTISGICHLLGAIILVFEFLAIVANVVVRAAGNSMVWVEEVTGYATVWAIYLGLAYTLHEGKHVKVELITEKLPPLGKKVFQIIGAVANIIFSVIIAWKAIELIQVAWQTQRLTPLLSWPVYPLMLVLPLGMILFALVALSEGVAAVMLPEGKWKAEETELDEGFEL
ncbi:Tripartite ATP-independent periplasmic transporter, DctQ component [Neomoorella glycerini]|uniref:Tripartite ATP-independent periplasmic transporter, DctQ component n=1 Tax=Neomoorella glycerini TaxID=55779 RepID=A0A6I5ZU03_9FIRM|nr:TRAP transporter small permease [Moorella glycerini]QGP93149.1 Tripartite ATP-independent periplasmic transporter, DctQ component [Moorella glycerini]